MNSDELLKKKGGLFSVKIKLTDAFDAEDALQADSIQLMSQDNDESHYIVLRELTNAELMSVQSSDENSMYGELEKLIPGENMR